MLLKTDQRILVILLLILLSAVIAPICYANSAEPPSILIIVPDAPADLEIYIGSSDIKANKTDKIIENYYAFYSHHLSGFGEYTLNITTGDSAFETSLGEPLQYYNNIFTLDLKNQTLTPGKSLSRSIRLVALRIALTLIIEAFVFLLFGYRQKKSWIAFLIINLLTQGVLNIWINGFTPLAGYLILALIFGEVLVFIVEVAAFLTIVKEHRRLRTFYYVLIANLLSLILGGYVITVLPI